MTPAAQQIEALLFLSGEAVALKELARLAQCSPSEVQLYLAELSQALTDHGLTILTTDTHAQLVTSPAVADYVRQYIATEAQELSAAAAETLALVAYRGPLTRTDIDVIRGVDSRHMIRQLTARALIRRTPKSQPTTYTITEEFLQHLGLTSTAELPEYDTLSNHEKVTLLLHHHDDHS